MSNDSNDIDPRLRLYRNGFNDRQISGRVGVDTTTIFRWRKALGLPPNGKTGGIKTAGKSHERRMQLYRLGWSDDRIGAACGVQGPAIAKWRKANGLKPKHAFFGFDRTGVVTIEHHDEERRWVLYRRGLNDAAIGREVGLSRQAIYEWRGRRGLPLNEPDRDWKRPPSTMVSMDADLGEGGFNRHSFIADDAAAQWLEENGSTVW